MDYGKIDFDVKELFGMLYCLNIMCLDEMHRGRKIPYSTPLTGETSQRVSVRKLATKKCSSPQIKEHRL